MDKINFFTTASPVRRALKRLGLIDWPWVLTPTGFSIACECVATLWIVGRHQLVSRNEQW